VVGDIKDIHHVKGKRESLVLAEEKGKREKGIYDGLGKTSVPTAQQRQKKGGAARVLIGRMAALPQVLYYEKKKEEQKAQKTRGRGTRLLNAEDNRRLTTALLCSKGREGADGTKHSKKRSATARRTKVRGCSLGEYPTRHRMASKGMRGAQQQKYRQKKGQLRRETQDPPGDLKI